MNNTPTPPAAPEIDSLHASLLRSLQLTVTPTTPAPVELGSRPPEPDSGVEVASTIDDFSERSGSLADKLNKINKDLAAAPATPDVTPPPVEPATPPVAITPPVAPVAPPVEPVPVAAEPPRIKVPELPKPFTDDTVLPKPPITLDLNDLDEDELEEIRNAHFAEQKYPEKYAGHSKRVHEFIKRHKQFVAQKPDYEDSDEYKEFLRVNRPTITSGERKRLERERLIEDATIAAEQRMSSKTKRLEDEVTQLKATPIVEKTINDYKSLVKDVMPKDDDPIVAEAVTHMSTKAVDAGREFMLLSANLKPYDSKNETHRWLAEFIQEQGDLYSNSKHPSLKRGSKNFVPRAKYNSLPAEERNKHFTFTDEDVLQLIAVNAKAAAEYHSTQERERLKKAGYTRTPTVTPATSIPSTPPPPPAAEVSPRATSSVSGGGPVTTSQSGDPLLRWINRDR